MVENISTFLLQCVTSQRREWEVEWEKESYSVTQCWGDSLGPGKHRILIPFVRIIQLKWLFMSNICLSSSLSLEATSWLHTPKSFLSHHQNPMLCVVGSDSHLGVLSSSFLYSNLAWGMKVRTPGTQPWSGTSALQGLLLHLYQWRCYLVGRFTVASVSLLPSSPSVTFLRPHLYCENFQCSIGQDQF